MLTKNVDICKNNVFIKQLLNSDITTITVKDNQCNDVVKSVKDIKHLYNNGKYQFGINCGLKKIALNYYANLIGIPTNTSNDGKLKSKTKKQLVKDIIDYIDKN